MFNTKEWTVIKYKYLAYFCIRFYFTAGWARLQKTEWNWSGNCCPHVMVSKRDSGRAPARAALCDCQYKSSGSWLWPWGTSRAFSPREATAQTFPVNTHWNHWTVQSGQTSWCGNHSSVLRAALTLGSFFGGQGLVTFHILTLQIDNKQFVWMQPGQYMSISSSRFSYLFPDRPSLYYTSLYYCAQMLYICAIVA